MFSSKFSRAAIVLCAVAMFSLPFVGNAQTQTEEDIIASLLQQIALLQEQLNTLLGQQAQTSSCELTQYLSRGSSGAEVTKLQNHLTTTGDYDYGYTTGYFGTVTEAAVGRFQRREGIVAPGGPGYGSVGPLTQERINTVVCGDSAPAPTPAPDPVAPVEEVEISLTRPVENTIVRHGENLTVMWESEGASASWRVRANLLDANGGTVRVNWAGGESSNDGAWRVTVLDDITPGRYRVQVVLADPNGDVHATDTSDLFTVESASGESITLTHPTTGSSVVHGENLTVLWNSQGALSTWLVHTSLLNAQGEVIKERWGESENDGQWRGTVQNDVAPGRYFVKVELEDARGNVRATDESGIFTVESGSGDTISVTHPDENTVLRHGENLTVQWNSSGSSSGRSVYVTLLDLSGDVIKSRWGSSSDDGQWRGTVQNDITPGRYRVQLELVDSSGRVQAVNESELFTVESASGETIALSLPNANTVIRHGEILDVTWTSKNALSTWSVYTTLFDVRGEVTKFRWGRSSNDGSWRGTIRDDVEPGRYIVVVELEDSNGRIRATDESEIFNVEAAVLGASTSVYDEISNTLQDISVSLDNLDL
ncbi:MAG: peptidoglycan-binding domain-containing protein [Candidatus Paceibacterota bacterium]